MPVSEQMGVLDLRQSQWIEAILVARAATSFMVFASCRRCLRSVSAMRHSTSMRAARMFEILTSRSEGMCLSSPIPQLLERKHTKTISALIHVKELAFGRCRLPQPQRAMLSARAALVVLSLLKGNRVDLDARQFRRTPHPEPPKARRC